MKIMISPADDEEEEIIIKRNALTADLLAGSHFDKCSTRSISTSRSYYGQSAVLELFVRKQNAFYGQTAIFDHFVRNLHFWSRPFTDRRTIFIDVSVNDSDFDKCSA